MLLTFFVPFLLGSSLVYWYEKGKRHQEFVLHFQQLTQSMCNSLNEPLAYFSPQEGLRVAQITIQNHPGIVEIYAYSSVYQMVLVHIDILKRRQDELLSHEQTVFREGKAIGKIRITVSPDTIINNIFSPFLQKVMIIFLGMSLIGFLSMGFAFRKYMILPMRKLLKQSNQITLGLMEEPCIWEGDDEFATLGKALEDMRKKLFIRFHKIHTEARTDPLTGISNRLDFLEKAQKCLHQSSIQNKPFSLIMFDLDDFKQINDHHGHAVGDKVLKLISLNLKKNLRIGDIFGRWGGEEFLLAICLPPDKVCLLAEKLRQVILGISYPMGIRVTASFGVVHAQEEDSFQTLTDKVDEAMYLAKKQGKNQVVEYRGPGDPSFQDVLDH